MKLIKKDKTNILTQYFRPILFLCPVLIFTLLYFLLLSPVLSQYQNVSQDIIQNKQDELEQEKKILQELVELNNIYYQVSPALKEKTAQVLPSQPGLPNLYYNLDLIAQLAEYKLLSIDIILPEKDKESSPVSPPADEVGEADEAGLSATRLSSPKSESADEVNEPVLQPRALKEIDINLNLEGSSYLKMKEFLDLIESSLRIFNIQSFSYLPDSETLDVKLKVYYYE